MEHFILLILASLPLAAPTPPHDRSAFPTLAGCEAAAARTPMPPGLQLVCVPVSAEPMVLPAMH
jgi:hypothetical protein